MSTPPCNKNCSTQEHPLGFRNLDHLSVREDGWHHLVPQVTNLKPYTLTTFNIIAQRNAQTLKHLKLFELYVGQEYLVCKIGEPNTNYFACQPLTLHPRCLNVIFRHLAHRLWEGYGEEVMTIEYILLIGAL